MDKIKCFSLLHKMDWNYTYIIIYLHLSCLSGLCTVKGQTRDLPSDSLRNVRLKEVVVTAIQSDVSDTRSLIGREAIRHIQASDLSGLSQLLPGVLTRNPNLNTPAVFTIRSVSYDDPTNALGTAVLVDGIRMNNNTNMQQAALGSLGKLYNSSALSGFDVRSLSPSSIESVEVIRGIPSVRYGDVTSGVVLVKSRAGVQPFTVGLRCTAAEKLFSAGKGWALQGNEGTLYLGADYALSNQDSRQPEQAFTRIGVQAAYAKDFPSATVRLNFRGYFMQDRDEKGKNMLDGEYQKTIGQGLSFSAGGQWNLGKSWMTNLEYEVGFTYGRQKNESSVYNSGTQQVTAYETQEGEHAGIFLPPNYFSKLLVEGEPLSADVSLVANLRKSIYNKVFSQFSLGMGVGTEGNHGRGISFDPLSPPVEMIGTRTRSYRDIPFVYRYSAFAENKIFFSLGSMQTELQAGVRFNYLQTQSIGHTPTVEPRVNIRQVLWEQKRDGVLNSFSLRAGWGLLRKMPVLAYLYPDKAYTDENCFTYNDAENNRRLAVLHTFVTDGTFNPQLRLPVNSKFELGANLKIKGISVDVVWFREHLRNGFCSALQADPFSYRRYTALTDKGEQPELTEEGIKNHGELLPYTTNTTFALYMRPGNGIEQHKEGVEYTVDLGRWNSLRTSFLVSGSYIKLEEKDHSLSAYHPQVELNGKPYPYVGIYETSGSLSNLWTRQLCSSRFQCITQIPVIGLVTTLTLQAVWMDRQRRGMESNYDNPVYLADDDGNRLEGNPMADTENRKRLNPVFYVDGEGNRRRFTQEMVTDQRFADLVMDANTLTAFQEDAFGAYFLLNLRVTKKIGKHVSVAFCANNLTRSNPKRLARSTQQYSLLNPELYYGAEVSIQF